MTIHSRLMRRRASEEKHANTCCVRRECGEEEWIEKGEGGVS